MKAMEITLKKNFIALFWRDKKGIYRAKGLKIRKKTVERDVRLLAEVWLRSYKKNLIEKGA